MADPKLIQRRKLRREATPTEQILWRSLRNNQIGAKFRRQHPIGPYIADFYSSEEKLILEVDGEVHSLPDQVVRDQKREAYLIKNGFKILRVTNRDIRDNLKGVLERIYSLVTKNPHPNPLPEGEGRAV